MSVKKKNGEPASLTSLERSIDRHLHNAGREYNTIRDRVFEGCHKALEAKRKSLGKGVRQNAAEPLTEGEEDHLWSSGELGDKKSIGIYHLVPVGDRREFSSS